MISREIVYKPFFRSNTWHARWWVEVWIASMTFKVVLLEKYIIEHFWIFGQEHTHHTPPAIVARENRDRLSAGRACAIDALAVLRHFVSVHTHTIIYACTHIHIVYCEQQSGNCVLEPQEKKMFKKV